MQQILDLKKWMKTEVSLRFPKKNNLEFLFEITAMKNKFQALKSQSTIFIFIHLEKYSMTKKDDLVKYAQETLKLIHQLSIENCNTYIIFFVS